WASAPSRTAGTAPRTAGRADRTGRRRPAGWVRPVGVCARSDGGANGDGAVEGTAVESRTEPAKPHGGRARGVARGSDRSARGHC
ncbi:MAG: hypothetical protein AVDCRST_MAG19-2541, partial [uncultured Thermomicrobiales bacterium]